MASLEAFGFHLGPLHMQTLATIILGAASVYAVSRCIYLRYFHPLSKFPGPPLAAVSNTWYAYHWLSGRYPWAVENAIRKYGDVVRIAPNELVFVTPQAFRDIYGPHRKNLELFVKTEFNTRGKDLGGIIWEEDPVRHHEVAKKLSPAFTSRAIREMEPLVNQYLDYFVNRMKELGSRPQGVGLVDWTNWLAMDLSADLSCNDKMNEMKDMKNSLTLDVVQAFNRFATVMQVFQKFPLLSPFQYLFVPFPKLLALIAMDKKTREGVVQRIERGTNGTTEHVDFFEYIHPVGSPAPAAERELTHLGSIAAQVMFAEFGPVSDWWYATIYYLLEELECYRLLVDEIRAAFSSYEGIEPRALKTLPYLHACLEESLRLFPSNNTGMPRYSPGAKVDGHFIPKGTTVQTSIFALARSPRYFHEPLRFRPQRWLPADHPLHDAVYSNDERNGLFSFSLGPRVCMGKDMAWMQGKLFMAKVLWMFDLAKPDAQQRVDLEGGLRHFGFFVKPEVNVRFIPVSR
ncbi:cytochrome P450 monooxygenase [Triangularia verruculosa]|uniref:Cytochrome P450 monooxygenase n=1 Tax=Triangularia verruculosa TaxID=2587418 RepID=A0AAN6X5W4_9PEZI|nr:cytochrome P450 monooxygenase [Triangularia verruculosa]